MEAPPERRDISPLTGWTRAHWEWAADVLLAGVRPFSSPGHALINLPGRPSRNGLALDGLEGFARTFQLAAFRLAGAAGEAPGGLAERYALGLSRGTDRGGAESWPQIERRSQSIVEAAGIAAALFESRSWIWDRLEPAARDHAAAWLGRVRGELCYPNNWRLLPAVVHAFLKSVDSPYSQDEIDGALDFVEDLYRGDGWYADGHVEQFDHYAGWSLHFYLGLWARMDGDRNDPARTARFRDRLARFLDDYHHLFAADGAPLFHGRSLTYRFAAAAPFWTGALADATPLSAGETRRLASGALRYFLDRGALEDGLLTGGWHNRFWPMLQSYSSPGSPYEASKSFLGLVLPAGHPAWTETEEQLPAERSDFCRAMRVPGFLAWSTEADGIVRVASHRGEGRRADPFYRKLGYSTHTAPDLPEGIDSELRLVQGGKELGPRALFRPLAIADRFAASAHQPAEAAGRLWRRRARLETASIACGAAEIRLHLVRTAGACEVRDGGFAVAGREPPEADVAGISCAVTRGDGLTSLIAGLHGFERAQLQRLQGANAFGRHSATPSVVARHPGGERVYATLVLLAGTAVEPEDVLTDIVSVEVVGRRVVVARRGGEHLFVQLGRTRPIELKLGGRRISGRLRFARVAADGSSFILLG